MAGRQAAGNMNIFMYTRRVVTEPDTTFGLSMLGVRIVLSIGTTTDTLYYCDPQFLTIFRPAFDSLTATGWDGWDDTFYYGVGDFYTYCGSCGRP